MRLKSVDELPAIHREHARSQMAGTRTPRSVPTPKPAGAEVAGEQRARRRFLNEPVEFDGHKFDSRSELNRYVTLKGMAESGLIRALRVHPRYPLHAPNGELIGEYIADFDYHQEGKLVIEDCKSDRTGKQPLFQWKRRHVWAEYRIEIREFMRRWKKRQVTE